MTYRASLGTRGELRRIAAEAETATIDRVRPWHRRIQGCRLAPHVVVPQWIRSEQPAKPRTPPPILFSTKLESRQIVTELLDKALDTACIDRTPNGFIPVTKLDTNEEDIDPDDINIGLSNPMDASIEGNPLALLPTKTTQVLGANQLPTVDIQSLTHIPDVGQHTGIDEIQMQMNAHQDLQTQQKIGERPNG